MVQRGELCDFWTAHERHRGSRLRRIAAGVKERESDTRLQRIDPKLEAAGWAVGAVCPDDPRDGPVAGRAH